MEDKRGKIAVVERESPGHHVSQAGTELDLVDGLGGRPFPGQALETGVNGLHVELEGGQHQLGGVLCHVLSHDPVLGYFRQEDHLDHGLLVLHEELVGLAHEHVAGRDVGLDTSQCGVHAFFEAQAPGQGRAGLPEKSGQSGRGLWSA